MPDTMGPAHFIQTHPVAIEFQSGYRFGCCGKKRPQKRVPSSKIISLSLKLGVGGGGLTRRLSEDPGSFYPAALIFSAHGTCSTQDGCSGPSPSHRKWEDTLLPFRGLHISAHSDQTLSNQNIIPEYTQTYGKDWKMALSAGHRPDGPSSADAVSSSAGTPDQRVTEGSGRPGA